MRDVGQRESAVTSTKSHILADTVNFVLELELSATAQS